MSENNCVGKYRYLPILPNMVPYNRNADMVRVLDF